MNHWRYARLLLLLVFINMVPAAAAQVPEKHPGMAYRGWVFDGLSYREVFAPEQVAALYLLAGHPAAVGAHRTLIYYWPLTGRYLPDWSGLNASLAGKLEVTRAGRVVATAEPTLFSLVHPDEDTPTPTISLAMGAEAEQQYAHYQTTMEEYGQQVDKYSNELAAYEAQMREATKEIGAGKKDVVVPTPPAEPQQPALFVTKPTLAFVFNLQEGRYTIQLRGLDGQIVPGSSRTVIAFRPRRQGLSYTLIPEKKWTQPEQSDSPNDTLYLTEPSVFYLQPRLVREYNEGFYRKLEDPQDSAGRDDRWIWVQQELVRGGSLEVRKEGQPDGRVSERPYWVGQVSGTALGYNIDEYSPDRAPEEKPTFRAYRLELNPPGPGARIFFRDARGEVMAGSEREVRFLKGKQGARLYLPAMLPLLPALLLSARRRAMRSRS